MRVRYNNNNNRSCPQIRKVDWDCEGKQVNGSKDVRRHK